VRERAKYPDTSIDPEEASMAGERSLRNIEKRKKKARRVIPRAKVTRNAGNTAAARKRLKKEAGKARSAKARAVASSGTSAATSPASA
jgi:hypothetical protein